MRRFVVLLALIAALFSAAVAAMAKQPDLVRIPLAPLGLQNISNRYMLRGATMLTVNYVDGKHLLVTFAVSRLMLRLADCPTDDEDRTVKAVLLELPTGKELASTEWRFHDLGQYLWDLGGGVFLLRQRGVLTTFAPVENLATGSAFEQSPFLMIGRRINAMVVSASHDLLMIETTKPVPPKAEANAVAPADPNGSAQSSTQAAGSPPTAGSTVLLRRDTTAVKPEAPPVEITFLRLIHHSSTDGRFADRIMARPDGSLRTTKVITIPLTSEGFLETKAVTRDGVLFDFLTFTGKTIELGDFATSCPPKPTFISPSEFVAFGCRGSDEISDLAGFNLRGDLLWQMNFTDIHAYPSFVAAIPAGRFALSRTITLSHIFGSETPSAEQLTGQEVRVVQMYNGKQLLKVMTSPIQRAGQNFALSPDGMNLAIIHDNATVRGADTVHDTAVEIYPLPPLSAGDLKEMKAEAALAPEPANARMHFSIAEIKAAMATNPGSGPPQETAAPTKPPVAGSSNDVLPASGSIPSADPPAGCAGSTDSSANPAACQNKPEIFSPAPVASQKNADQEPQPEIRRKPPTLYEPAPANSTDSDKAKPQIQ